VFTQQATERLVIREARIAARKRNVDTDQARMRKWSVRMGRWQHELEVREQLADTISKLVSRRSTARTKIGRNERCPCGSGLK